MWKKIGILVFISLFIIVPAAIKASPAGHIVISEIKTTGGSGKSTDEFIEFYNPTDEDINLVGWQLNKKTASGNEYELVSDFGAQIIKSHSFLLVAHPVGYLGKVTPDIYYTSTNSVSDNNTIIILDNTGAEVDKVGFGTATDYEGEAVSNVGANKSMERKARSDSNEESMDDGGSHYFLGNGEDSDYNFNDFVKRAVPEPQNSQSELEYLDMVVPDMPKVSDEVENVNYSHDIIISELFPNPEGSDDGEFIELKNIGSGPVDMIGWQVGDNSTRRYTIRSDDFSSAIIPAGSFMVIPKEVSRIVLNNTSDAAKLYQPDGTLLDEVAYQKSYENQSYSLVDGIWLWTDEITPGYENVVYINNELPKAFFAIEGESFKVGQMIIFDASETEDADGDKLEYEWSFGDGSSSYGEKVEYSFSSAGEYSVRLLVRDAQGGEDEYEEVLVVSDYDYSRLLVISELLPNCSGPDKDCEFIELYNPESREVRLEGWQLTDLRSYYYFSEDITINANEYLVIERSQSKITLNNGGDTLYLLDPTDQIINGVTYEKATVDSSFSRELNSDKWQWTISLTPGGENDFIFDEEEGTLDAVVDSTGESLAPLNIEIINVTEALLGRLLRISGEVERANSRGIYLMDDLGNILRVYIQKKTGINQPDIDAGMMMTVVGVLDKTSAGLRLLPRTEGDIIILPSNSGPVMRKVLGESVEKEIINFEPVNKEKKATIYLMITSGVLIMGGVIYIVRKYLINKKGQRSM
ncbi:lamin tail domain-containing protein [Patescibacteria group bacterium]|nr:lamin tail domain-containing protein [Patescibacteria group bacterium]